MTAFTASFIYNMWRCFVCCWREQICVRCWREQTFVCCRQVIGHLAHTGRPQRAEGWISPHTWIEINEIPQCRSTVVHSEYSRSYRPPSVLCTVYVKAGQVYSFVGSKRQQNIFWRGPRKSAGRSNFASNLQLSPHNLITWFAEQMSIHHFSSRSKKWISIITHTCYLLNQEWRIITRNTHEHTQVLQHRGLEIFLVSGKKCCRVFIYFSN